MRKRILRTLVVSVLVCAMLTVPAFAESAVVTGSYVNMRSGPGTGYKVVDCLPKGAAVTVTNRSNSAWYAIVYDGSEGFMSASYLSIVSDGSEVSPSESSDASGEAGFINAMYVRFRSGPSSSSSILGEYNNGKAVTVLGRSGDWTRCVINGETGYVFSSYVSVGSVSSGENTQPAPDCEGDTAQTLPEAGNAIASENGGGFFVSGSGSYTEETSEPSPAPKVTPKLAPSPASSADDDPDSGHIIGSGTAGSTSPTSTPKPTPSPAPSVTPVPSPSSNVSSDVSSGTIIGDYVRFRTGPGTNYSIIDSYNKGKSVSVTGKEGDWTCCIIDGRAGYVYSQYVKIISAASAAGGSSGTPAVTAAPTPAASAAPTSVKDGYITGNNVRMRDGASMSAEILGELFFGNAVKITGTSGDWTAVTYNGEPGYVYSQYVREGTYSYVSKPAENETSTPQGKEIADFALQYVGYNYCWGGCDPSTGFDCSGLVYYTYKHFGYNLNRVAADQALNGIHVDPNELQPGDVLCFYSSGSYIGHAGIYIGDGKFVHAANSATGVIVSDFSGYYSTRGFEARRIIG